MLSRFLLAAAASVGLATPLSAAWARDLIVLSRGGPVETAQREAIVEPFAQGTGTPTRMEVLLGGLASLRQRSATGDAPWDIALVAAEDLQPGCDAGLFEKIDWTRLGGRERFLPQGVSDCGVGAGLASTILAWDRDKFPGMPSWADFWDVAKHPGKRGLRREARGTLEIALMADGVAPADVYRTLRSDDGVDRAFRKLDQLRPYLVFWRETDQPAQLLGSGEVLLTSAPSITIVAAQRGNGAPPSLRNVGVQWTGNLYSVQSWVIAKESPDLDAALKLLAFATAQAQQARLLGLVGFGGLVKGVFDGVPPEIAGGAPAFPQNLSAGLQIDEQFWRDNADKLNARFETWMAH